MQQITRTLADALAERAIAVNCVNSGQEAFRRRHMPRGRWSTPDEAADVGALLLAPEAVTITGQVFDAEGCFRRFTP